jgi:hypothetical protein
VVRVPVRSVANVSGILVTGTTIKVLVAILGPVGVVGMVTMMTTMWELTGVKAR